MGTTAADKRIDALRANDGSIDGALAELNTKLAAWLAAMKKGQTALLEDAGKTASALRGGTRPARALPGNSSQGRSAPVGRGSKLFEGQVPVAVASGCGQRTPKTPAGISGNGSAAPQDDEALLASLDAETAKAIRVKCRLANGKRDVRELLEEMRSARTPARNTQPPRPRWWRRGDERDGG